MRVCKKVGTSLSNGAFQLLLGGLLAAISPQLFAESAIWSSRLEIFYSRMANRPVKLGAQEDVVANAKHVSVKPLITDFAFICPGDSFLVGMASQNFTEPLQRDRVFRFMCAFLENKAGEAIETNICDFGVQRDPSSGLIIKPDLDYDAGKPGESQCKANEILKGWVSHKYYGLDSDDRLATGLCCAAKQPKQGPELKVPTEYTSCATKAVEPGADINFMCEQNQVLVKIESMYDKARQDRGYRFTCCALEL